MADEIKPVDVPKPRRSLDQLLTALMEADDASVADLALSEELMEGATLKIDGYKYVLDHLKKHQELLEQWAEEYAKAAKTVARNRQNLSEHLILVLKMHGIDKFPGQRFSVCIKRSKPSVIMHEEPNMGHKLRFPDHVRMKLEWIKPKIYDDMKSGDEIISALGVLKDTLYPHFSLNPKKKDD